jgi:hypothetical protein
MRLLCIATFLPGTEGQSNFCSCFRGRTKTKHEGAFAIVRSADVSPFATVGRGLLIL